MEESLGILLLDGAPVVSLNSVERELHVGERRSHESGPVINVDGSISPVVKNVENDLFPVIRELQSFDKRVFVHLHLFSSQMGFLFLEEDQVVVLSKEMFIVQV